MKTSSGGGGKTTGRFTSMGDASSSFSLDDGLDTEIAHAAGIVGAADHDGARLEMSR